MTFAAVWLLTQRVRLTLRTLRALDLGVLIGGCGLFVWMALEFAHMREAFGGDNTMGLEAGLLAIMNVVSARAIAVPSHGAPDLLG